MTVGGSTSLVDREQVSRAVHALKQYVVEQRKTNLMSAMDEVEPIQLQFCFKKIHPEEQKVKITLPHSLTHSSSEVCLFVKDLDRTERDYQTTIKHYKKLLAQSGVACVSQIVPLKQIKLEYQAYEAKRNLSNMFNTFLADAAVMRLLPGVLGKAFYGRKKFPAQVNLKGVDLKKEFRKALSLTLCVVNGRGPSGLVNVAHSGLSDEDIVENVMTVVDALCKSLPGGANNMQNMHLKTADSPALLIHKSEDGAENVLLPSRRKRKIVDEEQFEDVSTVEGAKVKVSSEGHVTVKSEKALEAEDGGTKKKNRPRSQRNAAKAKTAQRRAAREKAAQEKQKEKDAKKNAKKAQKNSEDKMEVVEDAAAGEEGLLEKEREILELRRSRELDADLFSDTTADSELSDVEETTPQVKSVKSAKNTPKSAKSKKSGKGQVTPKKGKVAKATGSAEKAKSAKKARYF